MNGESPRLLLTGGGGLLGGTLLRAAPAGWDLHATQRARPVEGAEAHSIELSDASAVEGLVARLRPTLMIHAAASMTEGARDIVAATASIVAACAAHGVPLIHMSTDALLDGHGDRVAGLVEQVFGLGGVHPPPGDDLRTDEHLARLRVDGHDHHDHA